MTYAPRTRAMKHQTAALLAASRQPEAPVPDDVFAYLMEMGTGKSKVVLDEFGAMATNGGPQDLLVMGPAGSYRNWYEDKSDIQRSEIRTHMDPAFCEKLLVHGWDGGTSKGEKQRIERFLRVAKDRPRALFINIEAMSSVDRARDLAREFLSQRHSYFAVDESTKIKGWKSKRTRAVQELGEEASVRRILTGLLTPKSPMDTFSQFGFLHWKILGMKSFFAFRARYAVLRKMHMGGRSFRIIVGYQNVDELHDKIARYSYRALKKDCLDLEPKMYVTREVEHTPEQARMYRELRAHASTAIGNMHVSSQHAMTLMMRLHQINCGHVVDEEGGEHDVPSNRMRVLLDVLEEHQSLRHAGRKPSEDDGPEVVEYAAGHKVVIWTPYVRPLQKIVQTLTEEYGPRSVAQFHGGNRGSRGADERRFLGDPECRFMVATQGAGMMGNNWVVADLVVYFANDHDLEHRDQSEDRCHRKGQVNRVTYVDLVVPGTVDEKIIRALRNKIDLATAITGESYREWIV